MEINATLLIQGINFIVAWLLLKHVLLRSLFEWVETRQNYIKSLQKSIEFQNIVLSTLTEEHNACVSDYCNHFMRHAPDASVIKSLYCFKQTRAYPKQIEVKDEVVEKDVKRLVLILTEQLKQVRV